LAAGVVEASSVNSFKRRLDDCSQDVEATFTYTITRYTLPILRNDGGELLVDSVEHVCLDVVHYFTQRQQLAVKRVRKFSLHQTTHVIE